MSSTFGWYGSWFNLSCEEYCDCNIDIKVIGGRRGCGHMVVESGVKIP